MEEHLQRPIPHIVRRIATRRGQLTSTLVLVDTHLSTVPGHRAINIVPTTKLSPEAIFPTISGSLRPVRSTQITQHASPMSAMTEFPDCRPSVVDVSMPIDAKICGE